MNSYQKIKLKNKELLKELQIVCLKPESVEASQIILKYKLIKCAEEALWYGNMYEKQHNEFKGITGLLH